MRKWCAAAAVGVFLAIPLVAQQKDDSAAKPATETTTTVDAPAAPESSGIIKFSGPLIAKPP